jgi:hypothetical protein
MQAVELFLSSIRSPERSNYLVATISGPVAPAWKSPHNYGVAVDIYPKDSSNQISNSINDFIKISLFTWQARVSYGMVQGMQVILNTILVLMVL